MSKFITVKCVDEDLEFAESFLKETRAQRLGVSVRDIDCMSAFDRNRKNASGQWETFSWDHVVEVLVVEF